MRRCPPKSLKPMLLATLKIRFDKVSPTTDRALTSPRLLRPSASHRCNGVLPCIVAVVGFLV